MQVFLEKKLQLKANQEAIFYVAADATLGSGHREPYPIDALDGIVRWQWAMGTDFSEETAYKLQADHANIRVGEVTDESDDNEYTYTEVSILMPEMNTVELVEWIVADRNSAEVFIL